MTAQRRGRESSRREVREFDQEIIDIARVTRVVAGGKRMRFRTCVVIGDRKGRVGYAVAKGSDVATAVNKAVTAAKKSMMTVQIERGTIPHEARAKFSAARVLVKPAKAGTGLIAGGPLRALFELAGIKDIVSKMQGSRNKINNVKAGYRALSTMHHRRVKRAHTEPMRSE